MTRALIAILIIIFSQNLLSQKSNCGCDKIKIDSENQYKCDTTILTNGALIYWQWNCDSSWLTFENKGKILLSSCNKSNVYSCESTGLNFLKEYHNYILFQYKWISGCCTPPDLVFFNKDNGKEIKRITNELFIWGDIDDNYALYFSDKTYNDLIYLDHNTDNQYLIHFENGQVLSSANKNNVLQLSDLFKDFKKIKDDFTFEFKASDGKIEKR